MTTKAKKPVGDKLQVNTRLFREDVRLLKARAKEQGMPWQTLLRALVKQYMRQPVRSPKVA